MCGRLLNSAQEDFARNAERVSGAIYEVLTGVSTIGYPDEWVDPTR